MKYSQAEDLISKITYRPTTEFSTDYLDTYTIAVNMSMEVLDSDKKYAANEYKDSGMKYQSMSTVIDLADIDTPNELYAAIFHQLIMPFECHEAREFFAVDEDFYKPFHPHTRNGMSAYHVAAEEYVPA